jgi:hypothetical protein
MPFLPFVLLLAWQAVSRSASFALGWATALYFGQVPGRQGRLLAVSSLIAAGWVILVIGFAIPLLVGAGLEAIGVIDENFDVEALVYVGLVAGIVLIPPGIAAITVWGEFHDDRSLGTWIRLVPTSYPSTAMLGASVLQMVAFTPFLLVQRWRKKRKFVQIPFVMRERADDDALATGIRDALASIAIEDVSITEASNISVQGPKELTYRVRAAILRKLGFHDAYLTWNEEAQKIEDQLLEVHRDVDGDMDAIGQRLDEIQERMDTASINSEEWNVLYRRRLQVELAARTNAPERRRQAVGVA